MRADDYTSRLRFYASLALAVVPAIHVVGVILVFAYLLLPALAVWRDGDNGPVWQAVSLALSAALAGIAAAHMLDWPPSSAVVLALALAGMLWRGFARLRSGDDS